MANTGHSLFRRQHRLIAVLGNAVTSLGEDAMLTRRGVLHLLQDAFNITDRQALRDATIYLKEGWTKPNSGLNAPFGVVNSVTARIQSHSVQINNSRIENGKRGGRPHKPAWDVAPGSTGLVSRPIVETATAPQDDETRVWCLGKL